MFQRDQFLAGAAVAMALAHVDIFEADFFEEVLDQIFADQRLRHADRTRSVLHPDATSLVMRLDLQRGMRARGGGAADQERDVEILPLHFLRDLADRKSTRLT